MIDLYPVVSSAVSRAGYDSGAQILCVEYVDESVWEYRNVTIKWFENFCAAESKGKFLIGIRKDPVGYPARRVTHKFKDHRKKLAYCFDCGFPASDVDPDPDVRANATPCQPWPGEMSPEDIDSRRALAAHKNLIAEKLATLCEFGCGRSTGECMNENCPSRYADKIRLPG